jgi:hypothetical protein
MIQKKIVNQKPQGKRILSPDIINSYFKIQNQFTDANYSNLISQDFRRLTN